LLKVLFKRNESGGQRTTAMKKIEVFDSPMCCSTGVCGPRVNPVLPRFAADLDWLRRGGVVVERFNPAQQPAAFAENPTVKAALEEHGTRCLPLVLADGQIVSRGGHPSRALLALWAGLAPEAAPVDEPAAVVMNG